MQPVTIFRPAPGDWLAADGWRGGKKQNTFGTTGRKARHIKRVLYVRVSKCTCQHLKQKPTLPCIIEHKRLVKITVAF